MHDHEIKGVFRYQHWDRVHPVGVPDRPGSTFYLPMQYITQVEVTEPGTLLIITMAGGREHQINRKQTMDRFFEEYMAYQNAHERGL